MSYELYEVWAVTDDGQEELIDTTKSRKEALGLATNCFVEGLNDTQYVAAIVYQETDDGDLVEFKRFDRESFKVE